MTRPIANHSFQVAIAKAGGIPPLVQLLDDGTEAATLFAAEALDRLALRNPDIQAQIAKKLVALLSSREAGTQRRSARALWELSRRHDCAPVRIVNAGAISPLVALLGSGSLGAKEEAVGALTCLANNDTSNQLAIATGLVALLGSGSAEGQVHVTQMLIKFAETADNRAAIAKAGAILRLILQLRAPEAEQQRTLAAAPLPSTAERSLTLKAKSLAVAVLA
jgi:vacuolar protein 8